MLLRDLHCFEYLKLSFSEQQKVARDPKSRLTGPALKKVQSNQRRSIFAFLGLAAVIIAIVVSRPSSTPSVVESTATPTQKAPTLVDGAEKNLWDYLNDNFQGTDWFLWVDSSNYYVDGPVRVIDLNLNSFVSTDKEAAKSIAQTACIAVFTFWNEQERNGERSFEVLYVGDSAGNLYRREDYANGERCQGDG